MFCNFEPTYQEVLKIRKRITQRKLEGKIRAINMLVENAPADMKEGMCKQLRDTFGKPTVSEQEMVTMLKEVQTMFYKINPDFDKRIKALLNKIKL